MNEKFWDLKKSRQDSMINGALKVFAQNGFRHASTDEIVAGASVSKGLLFHYFYSKAGLYEFLAEYCARFALVELHSELRRRETLPFFELQRCVTDAEAQSMQRYPYIMLFLDCLRADRTAGEEITSSLELYDGRLKELISASTLPETMSQQEAGKIVRLLDLIRTDTASSLLSGGSFVPEQYAMAVEEYIQFFEQRYC